MQSDEQGRHAGGQATVLPPTRSGEGFRFDGCPRATSISRGPRAKGVWGVAWRHVCSVYSAGLSQAQTHESEAGRKRRVPFSLFSNAGHRHASTCIHFSSHVGKQPLHATSKRDRYPRDRRLSMAGSTASETEHLEKANFQKHANPTHCGRGPTVGCTTQRQNTCRLLQVALSTSEQFSNIRSMPRWSKRAREEAPSARGQCRQLTRPLALKKSTRSRL